MNKITCPECKGEMCWRKGRVPARGGAKQRYVCFDCGRTFYLPTEPPKTAPKLRKKAKPVKKVKAKPAKEV